MIHGCYQQGFCTSGFVERVRPPYAIEAAQSPLRAKMTGLVVGLDPAGLVHT